jgi:DNA repair protein RecO (recombination protein O)
MASDRLYRTEGVVVRRREQGEADRVLTLCTPAGKIDVIAKGARKLVSRKAGHIELFSRSSFVVARITNSWDIISQAETIDAHEPVRADVVRGAYARYAVELYDRFFTPEHEEGGPAVFDLLNHTLSWLGSDEDPELAIRFYEMHLLALAGFRPELDRCVGEHQVHVPLRPGEAQAGTQFGFDPERGGGLCPACFEVSKRFPGVVPVSARALGLLQRCQRESYGELRREGIDPAARAEGERVLYRYMTHHLGRGLKSAAFLRRLKRNPAAREGPGT